jgi:glycosyltransferase involved in cell wall biosynthesis
MSVIICSLNGAQGLDRCLRAVQAQTIRSALEVIVVDDGSTDGTGDVGHAHGAIVLRHATNLGLAAARNSGLRVATAPVVAFLDDDCEPEPQWATQLLAGYQEDVTGVGGPIRPAGNDSFMAGYLERHNPLTPQELNLAVSNAVAYRFLLYLRRQWTSDEDLSRRDVYSFAGANMSFRRQALADAGQFDDRFRFGSEELDLCMRLARAFPAGRLVFIPDVRVVHHFQPSVRDTLRRSRAYGRGSARLNRKWPDVPPTVFPAPLAVLALLLGSVRRPWLAAAAVMLPQLMYPAGLRQAIRRRSAACMLDAYLQLAQEACGTVGFAEGLWRFRHLVPEAAGDPVRAADQAAITDPVP